MQLSFELDGAPAEFRRNSTTGTAELRVGDDVVSLQSARRLSTHFTLRTTEVWSHRIGEHDVEVVKVRPRVFGGFRQNEFTVSVDKKIVAQTTGR